MAVMVLAVWTRVRLPREGRQFYHTGRPNAKEQVDSAVDSKN